MKAAYPIHPEIFRPALRRLVHPGEVPAHPRGVAADGGGDPQPLGERATSNPLILPANLLDR